jgi:hypothetical protein
MIFLIITSLTLSGCFSGTASAEYPNFPETPNPDLHVISRSEVECLNSDVLKKILENDQRLKTHIQRLQAQIEAYEAWVKRQP